MFLHKRHFALMLFAALLFTACNLPANPTSTPIDQGAIYTQAAETVRVQLTQIALGFTATPQPGQPSQTSEPNLPTATPQPTNTPLPTATLSPTQPPPTATSAPTATPVPCNWAEFVRDVTVPDNTTFNPGASFTKTWRLKNIGSCTWTNSYKLVFFKGDSMGADTVPLPGTVRPGESINLSVDLVAPSTGGTYRGDWMLRDANGRFGIGDSADKPFWVQIKVAEPTSGLVYNLANNFCTAEWESDAGSLPCPGSSNQDDGFVVRLPNPSLENRHENEPALWTNPERVDDGWITGTYPAFKIKDGDHFLADIGCLAGYPKCDVIFQLNYRVNGPGLKKLGEWNEVYDGKITRINVDLSDLAGKSVQFVLTVLANGSSKDDAAFWLVPQVYR
jgi:hypothetical protein